MPHRSLPVLFVAAIAALDVLAGAAQGQTPAPPRLTYERVMEKSPTPQLVGWIEDQAEHYGKLVSNYRAVGIVPPASRTSASQ